MKGGRKRKPKNTQRKKNPSKTLSSPNTEESDVVPCNDFAAASQTTASSLPSTPTRWKQEAQLTSTPEHRSSTASASPCGAKRAGVEYTEPITQFKASESKCCESKSQVKCKRAHNSQPRQLRKRTLKEQVDTCSETNNPPAKPRRGNRRNVDTVNLQTDAGIQSSKRSRPKFELKQQDDSWLSSDLSIELSHSEEPLPIVSFQEDEDSDHEDDEELPSFSMQMVKDALCIADGHFVWYKCRNYPFWPALVKKVNRKLKKASIIFIDDPMINKKGHFVTLKILKPFDCEEHDELVCKAKEQYHAAINWSLDLINDYRIRIACGSFSGSFIEYFAHDMSYPVRRTYPKAASEQLTIASDTAFEELSYDHKEDSFNEQQTEASGSLKRLLPDRTQAAHNRANERLVHFIVKQRMVDDRLLAVIRGQQQSRWLRSFLSAKRRQEVNIYLEDDQQLDQVYWYLSELYTTAIAGAPSLAVDKSVDSVPFVLDVLLPEAIIYAIAGVDNVSIKKAEEKYLRGRCISNREKEEFDLMIDRLIMKKSQQITA